MYDASILDVAIFFALASAVTASLSMSAWLSNKSTMGIHRDRVLLDLDERKQWEQLVETFHLE